MQGDPVASLQGNARYVAYVSVSQRSFWIQVLSVRSGTCEACVQHQALLNYCVQVAGMVRELEVPSSSKHTLCPAPLSP